jgi:hypothetical protein
MRNAVRLAAAKKVHRLKQSVVHSAASELRATSTSAAARERGRSWSSCLPGLSVVGPEGRSRPLVVHDAGERYGWSVPVTLIFLVRQSVLLRKCEPLKPVQSSARTYPHPSVRGDDGDGTADGLLKKFDPI